MTGNLCSSIVSAAARVADEQLALALAALHDAQTVGSGTVPDARRHIRRVKVLMQLIDPFVDDHVAGEGKRRLRAINRRLAPIAERAAGIRTLAHLAARHAAGAEGRAIAAMRRALVERAEENNEAAAVLRLLRRSEIGIAVERARLATWTVKDRYCVGPVAAFEDGARHAIKAMAATLERPISADHVCRRLSTELWVRLRLPDGRHRDLSTIRRLVEAMEASLEESHSVTRLAQVLTQEVLGSRGDTAAVLRRLRGYRSEVRARAVARGKAVLGTITAREDDHAYYTFSTRRTLRRPTRRRLGHVPRRGRARRPATGSSARRPRHRLVAVRGAR